MIDNVPPFVKDFAIETFGTNDKPALVGIGVTLLVYASVIGALSFRRRIEIGLIGIGLFGLIGAAAATTNRAGGTFDDALPAVVGSMAGAMALWMIHRVARPLWEDVQSSSTRARTPNSSRRPIPPGRLVGSCWFAAVG